MSLALAMKMVLRVKVGYFKKPCLTICQKNAEFAKFENGGSAPCMFANHQIIKIFQVSVALLRLSLMDKRVDDLTTCEIRSDNVYKKKTFLFVK